MKKCLFVIFVLAALAGRDVCAASPEQGSGGASHAPASPHTAIISPAGARLQASEEISAVNRGKSSYLEFVIPGDASNLQIGIEGRAIARWTSFPVILDNSGSASKMRNEVENDRMSLDARLLAVNDRLAVWRSLPPDASAEELGLRQRLMAEEIPALALEKSEIERRLKLIDQELLQIPATPGIGQKIAVELKGGIEKDQKFAVSYSYDLQGCGWEAAYVFNARPDEPGGGVIEARVSADVWQYSGINWSGTRIVLAASGRGPLQPPALREWVIDSSVKRPAQAVAAGLGARNLESGIATMSADARKSTPLADTETLYATWTLPQNSLPEGRSRIRLSSDTWKTSLEWLARPVGRGVAPVWLQARQELPKNQAWPAGVAEYAVNGQNVGSGFFRPDSGKTILFFGVDPRVSVISGVDSKKQGESGIINASKNWEQTWTFVIANSHDKPVNVRVERPAPMIVDEGVTVSYADKPVALLDAKKHMIYWVVEAPAHGQTEIEQTVSISSPVKLPLQIDAP